MRIVQISDLHVNGPSFVPEWAENVVSVVNSIKPDIIIVNGDLTDDGYAHEYNMAKAYIDRLEAAAMIVVPGNHDVRNDLKKSFKRGSLNIRATRLLFWGSTLLNQT